MQVQLDLSGTNGFIEHVKNNAFQSKKFKI